MSDQLSDFRQLLVDARYGDTVAMDQLIRRYEPDLIRVVKARLGNALRPYVDSVDLVQSVHKSVLMGLRNDKLNVQSPEHLLRLAAMMVRRKIARKWKRHRRQLRIENRSPGPCDSESLAGLLLAASKDSLAPTRNADINERLQRLFAQLKPLERQLIELRLEGHSTASAARILNVDSDVLRARLGRLRNKLETTGLAADWF